MQRGTIVRHRNSWTLLYYDVVYKEGKPKRVRVRKKLASISKEYPTARSVRSLADDLLQPINRAQLSPESSMRITDFIEKHCFPVVEHELRPSTVLNYRVSIYEKHLKNRLGKLRLRDFRTVTGQRLIQTIASETPHIAHITLLKTKNLLSGIFTFAKRQGVLDGVNPMQGVYVPGKTKRFKGGAYDIADVERMLEEINDETTQDVLALLSFTGLRSGEARGLRWSDWNEKDQTLTIARGVWRNKVGPTKNVQSEGEIPVLPLLQSPLENRRSRIKPTPKPSDYIFAGVRRGAPLDFHNLENRIIRPALKGTPVKWVGFHGFRRGIASNLFAMGVNPRVIAGILRHSGLAMALAHYIKTPPEESRAALLKLERESVLRDVEMLSSETARMVTQYSTQFH